ncbi:MAG: hypothetical protein ACR2GX_00720 [Candidatus Dormibacteria bacterium]
MFVLVCVLVPRLALTVALGGERARLLGDACALAPEAGATLVGECSPAAEAAGVRAGMRLGEAFARSPALILVPPDPLGAERAWEEVLIALEGIGAFVESVVGIACFRADALLSLYGTFAGVVDAVHQALGHGVRVGIGPSRFLAVVAAQRAGPRRPVFLDDAAGGDALANESVNLLRLRPATAGLVTPLERLGIATFGDLCALGRIRLCDRFGTAGAVAWDLCHGGDDTPLRPRRPPESVKEELALPESGSSAQIDYAIGLLVDRLLRRRARRGRGFRSLVLGAQLSDGGGSWRDRVVFREPLADAVRIRRALSHRLLALPAPAEQLSVTVEHFGPAGGVQGEFLDDGVGRRRARVSEGIRQARVAGGAEAILQVREAEPDSHIPERRHVLAPYQP